MANSSAPRLLVTGQVLFAALVGLLPGVPYRVNVSVGPISRHSRPGGLSTRFLDFESKPSPKVRSMPDLARFPPVSVVSELKRHVAALPIELAVGGGRAMMR